MVVVVFFLLLYFLVLVLFFIPKVAPITIHPTIDKAAHYFGLKVIHTPVTDDFKADIKAMEKVGF